MSSARDKSNHDNVQHSLHLTQYTILLFALYELYSSGGSLGGSLERGLSLCFVALNFERVYEVAARKIMRQKELADSMPAHYSFLTNIGGRVNDGVMKIIGLVPGAEALGQKLRTYIS